LADDLPAAFLAMDRLRALAMDRLRAECAFPVVFEAVLPVGLGLVALGLEDLRVSALRERVGLRRAAIKDLHTVPAETLGIPIGSFAVRGGEAEPALSTGVDKRGPQFPGAFARRSDPMDLPRGLGRKHGGPC
jgi:hypothetical protein